MAEPGKRSAKFRVYRRVDFYSVFSIFFKVYSPCVSVKIVISKQIGARKMFEDFAWDMFTKTGSIDGYLLYKQTVTLKEKCGDYGACKDQWRCDTANQSERQ